MEKRTKVATTFSVFPCFWKYMATEPADQDSHTILAAVSTLLLWCSFHWWVYGNRHNHIWA